MAMGSAPVCLFRRFVEVGGDDAGTVRFEPAGPSLPRSRAPRPTLEFTADGGVTRGVPGPGDARVPRLGRWDLVDDGSVVIRWSDSGPDTVVEIVRCDDSVLQLAVRAGSLD